MAQGAGGGQPAYYTDVDDLQRAIDKYFEDRDAAGKPYTVTGLALALGFTSRAALINYEKAPGYEKFFNAVKRAKLRCEGFAEDRLYGGGHPAGPIFALKNYGWSDKQEITISGTDIKVVLPGSDPDAENV